MKNFLIIVAIFLVVIGTCFGIKAEVDAFNKKYNPTAPVEEAQNLIEDEEKTIEETEEDLDLSELNY